MKISSATFAGSSTRISGKPGRKLPEFAFIGRSNVGKSSLINMLTGNNKLARTSATPGKTQLINHFLINDSWYLVDLPGYGFAKLSQSARAELARIIREYILASPELVLLFVLVDSRHDIGKIDLDFIRDLGENGVPFAIIFTKGDKQGPNVLAAQVEKDRQILLEEWEELPPMFVSSAQTGAGKEDILSYIENVLANL
ncbi:MAG: YihA family ribosome biogenesis GTP-binding protein [Bacteroidales bacterium]|jgi:GTP-binding protein|nr:YihA family ribosome biogenesis GTP-binding protein [Bacteroidales bacterium]MBR1637735.1 YihA family ribosome biogenesis GTP-binding protein [Bacteroidales bacterium]